MDEVLAHTQTVAGVTKRYYPHYNHLYSVAALTDATGQVVERFQYNAYGTQSITSATGVIRQKSAVGFDRGFTGYVADNETGLLHARARQYSPTLGRFIGRDPEGYVDGLSLYQGYFVPNSDDPDGTHLLSWDVAADPDYADRVMMSAGASKTCKCCKKMYFHQEADSTIVYRVAGLVNDTIHSVVSPWHPDGQGGSNRAAPSVSKAHRSRVCDPDCPVGIRLTSVEVRSLGVGPCRHRAQVVRPAPAA